MSGHIARGRRPGRLRLPAPGAPSRKGFRLRLRRASVQCRIVESRAVKDQSGMPPLNEAARLLPGELVGGTSTRTMPGRTHPRPNPSRIDRRPRSPVRDIATGHATPPPSAHRHHGHPTAPDQRQRRSASRLSFTDGVSCSRIDRRALRNNAPTVRRVPACRRRVRLRRRDLRLIR